MSMKSSAMIVQVGVTYNPYRGNFDFVVEDWTPGGGDITFN